MFAIGQSNFLQALGWAVLNSLWQMALLWVLYQLLTAVFQIKKSSGKALLATTLLFAGFAWFVFTFFAILADKPAAQAGYSAFITVKGNDALNNWLSTMLPVASILYLVLLVLPVMNFIRNYRYVRFIRVHGLKKADVKWRMFTRNIAAQMGINRPAKVWMSELVNSPVTIGYVKPLILLPLAAVNQLSTQQIEAILLHELVHIRRADYLVNLFARIIQTILYFNPFVKAFASIIEKERERHCDEMVLQFQYEPHGYASALLELEKAAHTSRMLAVAAAGNKKNELLGRIETIMGVEKKPVISFSRLAGVLAALLCFISLNALLLVSRPGDSKTMPGLLTELSDPFRLLSPADDKIVEEKVLPATTIVNTIAAAPQNTESKKSVPAVIPAPTTSNEQIIAAEEMAKNLLPYAFVNFKEDVIPDLDEEAEEQVKEALVASKKVIEETQWKNVETTIADALTAAEKERVKMEYHKAMSKLDWKKMEDKLKTSYDQINWDQVNSQLSTALVEIKLDSLQKVYTVAASNLASLQKELEKHNQPGVPDTDLTLENVETKKKEVIKAINVIKAAKNRKIVHL